VSWTRGEADGDRIGGIFHRDFGSFDIARLVLQLLLRLFDLLQDSLIDCRQALRLRLGPQGSQGVLISLRDEHATAGSLINRRVITEDHWGVIEQ
jgi:hypothetical protein